MPSSLLISLPVATSQNLTAWLDDDSRNSRLSTLWLVASTRPSHENARAQPTVARLCSGSTGPSSIVDSSLPAATFQRRTRLAYDRSPSRIARALPSGENAACTTLLSVHEKWRCSLRRATSHSCTVPSSWTVSSVLPSAAKAVASVPPCGLL